MTPRDIPVFPVLRSLLAAPQTHPPMAHLAPPRHAGDDAGLSADSRQFLAAWRAWRGAAAIPQRRDMDLVSIARLMPQLVLLDVFSTDRTAVRLAGNDIEQFSGLRLMGRDYLQLLPAEQREMRGRLIWHAVNHPYGIVAFYGLRLPDGSRREIQVCAAPLLANEPDAPRQMLAVVSNLPPLRDGKMPAMQATGMHLHLVDLGAGLPTL